METSLNYSGTIRPIEIDWFDETEVVRVTPRDQTRFDVQKDKAIEALRQVRDAAQFTNQFHLLLQKIGTWVRARTARISKAIVTLQDNSLVFVVVQSAARYDENLQDDLSDLDLAIANDVDLNLVKLRTLVLPLVDEESLRSFLDERMVLAFSHGN